MIVFELLMGFSHSREAAPCHLHDHVQDAMHAELVKLTVTPCPSLPSNMQILFVCGLHMQLLAEINAAAASAEEAAQAAERAKKAKAKAKAPAKPKAPSSKAGKKQDAGSEEDDSDEEKPQRKRARKLEEGPSKPGAGEAQPVCLCR